MIKINSNSRIRIKLAILLTFIVMIAYGNTVHPCAGLVYYSEADINIPYSGGSKSIILNTYFPSPECINLRISYSGVPDWITRVQLYEDTEYNEITGEQELVHKLVIECEPWTEPIDRYANIEFRNNEIGNTGSVGVKQNKNCLKTWYKDTDRDGFGDYSGNTTESCSRPSNGWADNNLDACPDEYSITNNGCPEGQLAKNRNWISTQSRDITGKVIGNSITYFDKLGMVTQSQATDIKTGKVWATQTLYDAQGRPALSTFAAPIGTKIDYKEDFIKKPNGSTFSVNDLGDHLLINEPATIGDQPNTLGWYYSDKNTNEPYQDVTDRPYGRTFYSELNPGATLRGIGGNKMNGSWKNGYSFTMPASQELSQTAAFDDPAYNDYKLIKTVVRDVHGVEAVVFTDTDGNTLAAARSGNQEKPSLPTRNMSIAIGEQGYVDVHIPVGCKGITISNAARQPEVYHLIVEQELGRPSSSQLAELEPGFYRVAVIDPDTYDPSNPVVVGYPENYYDYSLNYYDKAGRLTRSTQPASKALESEYKYNTLGQLLYTKSPDEGEAWFKYRKDGQIRYSQNSKQKLANEVSYTNYDEQTRPIESGVLTGRSINTLNPDGVLPAGTKKEQLFTVYDVPDLDGIVTAFNGSPLRIHYTDQTFVSGAVAKTYTQNPQTNTTWYSYDHYGRVKWIVQKIQGLSSPKTIDYEYDDVTGAVTKVYYQKEHSLEQFVHRYTYDPDDYNLVKVETSEDDIHFTEHASYSYYETGELKRTNLGQGTQGIDYVYNLSGALKSINHPSLQASKDPGGDANDAFGMNLHYYKNDYKRNNTPKLIATIPVGADQFNGNIKAAEWHTKGNGEGSYYYKYNRNNWLTEANFGNDVVGGTAVPETLELTEEITSDQEAVASKCIRLTSFFKVPEGTRFNTRFEESAGSGNDDYRVSNITYDANGNIQTLNRNKQTEAGSNLMDQLSYSYKADKPNQLLRVDDAVTTMTNADDIKDQDGENYVYNSIGQLVRNVSENVEYIYNVAGLVTEVKKDNISLLKLFYDDRGHRLQKESYNSANGTLLFTEHYVRDATGKPMAIYRNGNLEEHSIYGNSRLGIYKRATATSLYEVTDHLGNVRAVVERNNPTPRSASDYYPFGMTMPGRTLTDGEYRYAFQGQEKDPETGKEAFQLRLWDGRIGRWLTTDPYGQYSSPYLGMGNSPLNGIDPDGGCYGDPGCPDNPVEGDTYTPKNGNGAFWSYEDRGWVSNHVLWEGITVSAYQAISVGPTPAWMFTEVDVEFHADFYAQGKFGFVQAADMGPAGVSINQGAVEVFKLGYKYDIVNGNESGDFYRRYIGENGQFRLSHGARVEYGADVKGSAEYILDINKGTFYLDKASGGIGAPFVELKAVRRHSGVHSIDVGGQEEFSGSAGLFSGTLGFNVTLQFNLTNPGRK